jgi:hypothetical protein
MDGDFVISAFTSRDIRIILLLLLLLQGVAEFNSVTLPQHKIPRYIPETFFRQGIPR